MEGRATFTIVVSRMIMSIPTHRTTSATQRSRSRTVGAATVSVSGIAGP
jgi:hypothetical protein